MLERKLSDAEVHAIVEEAVAIETEFVTSALPSNLIGINADLMTEYVRYCADRLLFALGAPKLYNASQPFGFMEMISLEGKTCTIRFNTHLTTNTHSRFTLYATGTFSKSVFRSTPRQTLWRACRVRTRS